MRVTYSFDLFRSTTRSSDGSPVIRSAGAFTRAQSATMSVAIFNLAQSLILVTERGEIRARPKYWQPKRMRSRTEGFAAKISGQSRADQAGSTNGRLNSGRCMYLSSFG